MEAVTTCTIGDMFRLWLRMRWQRWQLHRLITRLRRQARRRGIWSLDGYSDEEIGEVLRGLRDAIAEDVATVERMRGGR